ncbi:MAG: TRAP transporter small permease subunit [Methylobacteriaceae bacterium]|jgi:TRAP-type C4-dicarboxylate transport system permease small subunit|nr:TRAP transporter small permease subunit [Methylobacteriaceae bacterium]
MTDGTAYSIGLAIGSISRILRKISEYATALMFVTLFFAFVAQIFMRFILNRPLNWPEELSIICYIWIVFVACSFTLRDRQHVIFTIVADALPPSARRLLLSLASLFIAFMMLYVSWGIIDYVTFMRVEKTPALFWRKDYVFSIFIVFTFVLILRCLWTALIAALTVFAPVTGGAITAGFDKTAGFDTPETGEASS